MHSDDALALMADVGYTKPLTRVSQSDRKEIINAVQTFHLFIKVKAVMDQFQEGLRYARVHIYLKQFIRPLFVNDSPPLTSSMFH